MADGDICGLGSHSFDDKDIYGVMSYIVAQGTREIGIRMALGARQGDVLKLIVGRGMMLSGGGIAIGLLISLWAVRLLSSLLFGVSATDASVFFGLPVLLFLVVLMANYIPARRSTRIDPLIALRHD